MFKKCLITIVVVMSLFGCQPSAEVDTPTPESTATATKPAVSPTPTFSETPTATPTHTPSITPTFVPTLTPILNAQGYETVQDSRGHWMVHIPAGTFTMGLTEDQVSQLCALYDGECSEVIQFDHTPHEVTLTNDYWIDVYEVTNDQIRECNKAGICPKPHDSNTDSNTPYYQNMNFAEFPYQTADWFTAVTFCETWRHGRLPTEAEWEYAARGDDGRLWPWGNTPPNESLSNHLIPFTVGFWSWNPDEIGSLPLGVSPFGIFDMGSNVEEWTHDWYGAYPRGPIFNPQGPQSGSERVLRGGRAGYDPIGASTTSRDKQEPDYGFSYGTGIRCARDG